MNLSNKTFRTQPNVPHWNILEKGWQLSVLKKVTTCIRKWNTHQLMSFLKYSRIVKILTLAIKINDTQYNAVLTVTIWGICLCQIMNSVLWMSFSIVNSRLEYPFHSRGWTWGWTINIERLFPTGTTGFLRTDQLTLDPGISPEETHGQQEGLRVCVDFNCWV